MYGDTPIDHSREDPVWCGCQSKNTFAIKRTGVLALYEVAQNILFVWLLNLYIDIFVFNSENACSVVGKVIPV